MKYIKSYENFKPIKINSAKPFKMKKNIPRSMRYLQKHVKSLRKRIYGEEDISKRAKMNKDINDKVKKLGELNHRHLKQVQYLKDHPVKESSENEESKDLIQILTSPDFKAEDILNYIGLESDEYEIETERDFHQHQDVPKYNQYGITFVMHLKKLEELMDIEENVLSFILQLTESYNDYDYYVDDSELDYIDSYLSEQTLENIKKLSILFDHEINPEEEGEIKKLFEYLGLDGLLDDIKTEISMENERAVEKAARELVKSLPFGLDFKYAKPFDIELDFDYEKMISYMKEHNMKVYSIKEFLENIYEASDFNYSIEYEMKQEFLGDFDDLKRTVDNNVDEYLSSPDDIFPLVIAKDNLDLMKDKIELANFEYVYDVWLNYKRTSANLFEIAKFYNKSILEWFQTYDFQYNLIGKSNTTIYKNLKNAEIINPEIEKEFAYLVDSEHYNL